MAYGTLCVIVLTTLGASSQPASAPTTTRSSGDPAVDRILDELETRGADVESLTSDLRADFLDVVAADEQSKVGKLWFRRDKPNPKFKIIYEKSIYGNVEKDDVHEYLFDGQWLTEKHDAAKSFVERRIVKEGEKIEPFRIGKGPFPLPFGQKKAEILEHFTVTKVRRSPKDPPNTDHLKLIPRQTDSEMAKKYAELHFYIDKKLKLPTRIVAHQRNPGSDDVDEIVTVTFTGLKVNPGVSDKVLMIAKPQDRDWHFTREDL
ncbi:MAG: hypothetical protein JXQ73_02320 [Phycisphaerae bacterium]|nr:hypothetical protein [Phycisphaerae bacterium]